MNQVRAMKKYKTKVIAGQPLRVGQFQVTMWIDKEVLDVIRVKATEDRMKYQPWLNRFLRANFLKGK